MDAATSRDHNLDGECRRTASAKASNQQTDPVPAEWKRKHARGLRVIVARDYLHSDDALGHGFFGLAFTKELSVAVKLPGAPFMTAGLSRLLHVYGHSVHTPR